MSKALTEWGVEGELWCPDCGEFIDFDGTLPELLQLVKHHDLTCCSEETG